MALQAFIDDSGSEPQSEVFVLAGHIAPTDNWARFSDEWAVALAKPPGAAYFKAAEAMHLNGEFHKRKGWDSGSRDERVIELAEIIARNCTFALSAVIRHDDFKGTIKRLPMFSGERTLDQDHPYMFLWYHLLSELWLQHRAIGLGPGPCDFIFDEQIGFANDALRYWQMMKEIMNRPPAPAHWTEWMGSPPIFRDDKDFLPLQAADMWAWSNRRAICHTLADLKLPGKAIEHLCSVPPRHLNFTREYLVNQAHLALSMMKEAIAKRSA